MHIVSGLILREIMGETVAVPSGNAAHLLSGLVVMNETGAFLFELLKTERTFDELVQAVLVEYDTDPVTAHADVTEYLELLRQHRLLVEG